MGQSSRTSNFDAFDDYDEDYEKVAQRPRANVPPGPLPTFVLPQYTRLTGPVRVTGGQTAPRQHAIPQPLPGPAIRPTRPSIPSGNTRG